MKKALVVFDFLKRSNDHVSRIGGSFTVYNNEMKKHNSIDIEKIKQKIEKIKKSKSKIVGVPSLSDEVIYEKIKEYHSIQKDITKPNLNKYDILEEKEDKKVKEKKEKKKIEKINIIDDEIPSNNLILHNPKYAGNKNEENEINLLGKLFSNKPEIAPINISKELKEKIIIE